MVDYAKLQETISELENSVAWVKALAEVAQLAHDSSDQLEEAANLTRATLEQSKVVMSEIVAIYSAEQERFDRIRAQLDDSIKQLNESTAVLSVSQLEMRQQILQDLTALRREQSTFHQDQIDRIKSEHLILKKNLSSDIESLLQIKMSEQLIEITNQKDQIINAMSDLEFGLQTSIDTQQAEIVDQFEKIDKATAERTDNILSVINERLSETQNKFEEGLANQSKQGMINRVILVVGFVILIATIILTVQPWK